MYASILQNALSYSIFIVFLGDYALMLAHLGVRSYGPKHLAILVTDLVYTPGYDHI